MSVTHNDQFRAQFWHEVDNAFWTFIGKIKPVSTLHAVRLQMAQMAYKLLGYQYLYIWARKNAKLHAAMQHFDMDKLDEFASWLGDDYSRQILIKLMTRKLFQGLIQLEPVIDKQEENAAFERIKRLIEKPETHRGSMGKGTYALNLYNLSPIGFPLHEHLHETSVKCTYIYEQYRYKRNGIDVGVEKGDIAIDGGGCWADTALYMAAKGAEKIYTFEFSADNLKILHENLAANATFGEHISLIEKALWNRDDERLTFETSGPATSVSEGDGGTNSVKTITLDTFVEQMKIDRIDFIKMDIEGAEMAALEGAKNTIRRFAPRLAITVYHKPEDFFTIPQFIKGLRPDYTLYLDHFTTVMTDTVLFAIPRER